MARRRVGFVLMSLLMLALANLAAARPPDFHVTTDKAHESVLEATRDIFGESPFIETEKDSKRRFPGVPRFESTESIRIRLVTDFPDYPKGASPARRDWYQMLYPEIRVMVEWDFPNLETIAVFDTLAEFSCKQGSHAVHLGTFRSDGRSTKALLSIKKPCVRFFTHYGICPQEFILMAQVRTKDGKYFYRAEKFYTCLLRGE